MYAHIWFMFPPTEMKNLSILPVPVPVPLDWNILCFILHSYQYIYFTLIPIYLYTIYVCVCVYAYICTGQIHNILLRYHIFEFYFIYAYTRICMYVCIDYENRFRQIFVFAFLSITQVSYKLITNVVNFFDFYTIYVCMYEYKYECNIFSTLYNYHFYYITVTFVDEQHSLNGFIHIYVRALFHKGVGRGYQK